MARSSIRVGIKPRARIRARALARFPAQVIAGDGISIAQAGGVFTFALDPAYAPGFESALPFTVGDIFYAGTASEVFSLAAAASGNALVSGGAGAAPAWSKVGLSTHVAGVLPPANGGTGVANAGTISLGGNLVTSGGALTFSVAGPASVAFGSGGTVAYQGGTLAQFAATTSAQLAGVISDETGTGALVFANAPAFTGGGTFTRANAEALAIRSGNSANYTYLGIGRAVTDLSIGAAAANDHFTLGAVAGDSSINAVASLHLAAGNTIASIKIGPAAGAVRFPGFSTGIVHLNAAGDVSSSPIAVGDFATTTANRLYGTNGSGAGSLITVPGIGITLSGGAVTLANDLAALEAMGGTGLVARTASETYAQRTATGTTSRITVTNGDGVSGNPTFDISASYVGQASITTLGTITSGAWNGTDIAFANIAQGSALSVLGVTGNATADHASIAAGSDHQVLRRSGTALAFGAVNLASSNAVTGNLPVTNLNGGSGASSSTFWRGDGVWATPAGSGNVSGPVSATDNAVARFDLTTGTIIQNSGVLIDDASNIVPATNDVGALGTTSLKWADAFFASGAVLNFNSGDVTVTHGSNALAFAGASNGYAFDAPLDLSAAAAGQIRFPATQNASANANTLDDYEEGTWTPTGNGVNFASASGSYTKIGRHVFVDFQVTWPSTANASDALIGSLPFNAGSDNGGGSVGFQSSGASGSVITINATTANLQVRAATGGTKTNADMSTLILIGSAHYHV